MRASVRSFSFLFILAAVLALVCTAGAVRAQPARAADVGILCVLPDLAPPVTTCDYDGTWRNAPVTLKFIASDSGSGVAFTEYSVNGGSAWTRGTSLTVAEQGVIPVLYRSVDNAGNTEATKTATVKMRGVALYAGADSAMSGTFKVTSPLLGSDPTAALYVNGKLTTGSSVDLSKVVQYVKAKGATVPPITQFMPDARVSALTTASQVAPFNSSTPKKDVTYSGTQNVTVTTPMTVNGNLSITGSGTYTFNAVYVTGNVSISSSSAKFSFASLRVGGSLSVTGGTALQWGPTYVAGSTTLSGTGQWNVGLFVTAGNVAISGAQTMAGDGTGTNAKPAIFLMTGSGKSLSISGGSTFYGLLCNRNGAISISSSSAVFKGSVLCGAAFTASGGSTIAFDPNVAASVYDVIAPVTTASQSPAATAAGWNNSAVTVRLSAVDDPGGSGIAKTSYTVDGGATQIYASNTPPVISGAGTHPVTYWSTDKAGNVEGSKSLTIKIETTAPTGSVTINGGAPWTDSLAATLTLSASDAGSGISQMRFSNDSSSWSAWQDYATSASWALASGADGTRTVFAQFSDKAGNVTAVTDTIGLDTTAPVVTISTPADGSVVTTSTSALSFTSTDAGSGVSAGSATMVLDSGTPVTPPANLTLPDGAHSVTITVADAAGNKGSARASFTVSTDSIPPTTTATKTGTGGSNGWYTGAVIVSLTATDVGSGVSATYYSIDGAATPSIYTAPFTVAGDAVHNISYWSTDNAGNMETPPKAAEVKIDGTPPVVTLQSLVDGSTTGYNRPALLFTPEDGAIGSGFDPQGSGAQVILDGHSFSAGSGYLFPTKLDDGEHTLRVTVSDLAGNEGSASSTFTTNAPAFTVQPETVYEGDVVGLYASDKPDVGDESGTQEGRTWQWSIARGADDPEPDTWAEGPVGYMVPDAATDYVVELTVTDTTTHAASVTSRTINVLPQAPRVHALDVDVLQGGSADLVARFLDPGWTDVHAASWAVDGQSSDGTLTEDDVPAMESGFISGTTEVVDGDAGVLGGTLSVTDSDLETPTTVPFKVNVIAPDPTRDEGNGGNATFDTATKLTSGQAHLSYIQSTGDIDIFEVRLADGTPDGTQLPYGTEVLVTLRDLPLDYDVAVIQDLGADAAAGADMQDAAFQESSFASAPHLRSSWDPSPHLRSPHLRSPHLRSPFYSLSLEDAPHLRSPHLRSPYLGSPYIDTPHLRSPHLRSDIEDAPHLRSPFLITPHLRSPHLRSPFDDMYYVQLGGTTGNTLDGYSFADMSFTGQSDDQTSGISIDAEELGFNNQQMAGKRLRFSATPGTATEVVLVTTDFVGGKTYVAVKGANGAFSETDPYTLQVETSQPLDVLSYVNTPKDDPLVTDGATDQIQMKVEQPDQQPLTLFVTQAERVMALYGVDGWSTVLGALGAASADPRVKGEVMSVPSVDFDDWDVEPWKPGAANAVTDRIRSRIGQYLSTHDTVEYVVLVGSDEVVPQRRVQDETVLGNEREYVDAGAFLKYDSPLLASMWREMVLTDDFYVDSEPIAYNEHALYIPDIAVSRLVEKPAEIAAQINVFLGRSPDGMQALRGPGRLDGSTAIVTGQDFMTNGVERVQATLQAAGLSLPPMLLDTWKAEDVQNGLFKAPRDVGGLNAHFAHFGAISAYGYSQMPNGESDDPDAKWDDTEFISGTDVTGTEADPNEFIGKLIFSMGCHAGLNVPDDQSRTVDPDYGLDPSLDIPQAMARTGGVLVASTGYGFGDTVTVSGTEALIGLFAEQITTTSGGGRQSIGLALAAAKRQYLGSLSTVTPYDEKSSIQFTMYGMPQYTLATPAQPTMPSAGRSAAPTAASAGLEQPHAPASKPAGGTILHRFIVTIEDEGQPPRQVSADLVLNDAGANGEYVTADGDAQATADRPIQPRLVVDLGVNDVRITAARVTAGSYVERDPFDPAIACWTTEWETYPVEFQVSTDGWWPADPVTLTTIETAGGYEQKLVILPGQFRATSASDAETVTGVERLWSDLTVKLVRQPADADLGDHLSPTVSRLSLSKLGDTVTAKVDASDASGISRIDVTHVGDGARAYFPFPGVAPGPDGAYDVQFDLIGVPADELAVVVDVMDNAGNVTTVTSKGAVFTPTIDVDASALLHVTTFAGTAGQYGSADGVGAAARFWANSGVACDGAGNVYVADTMNHMIRKITPDGVVTTLAGAAGDANSTDGNGGVARFSGPRAVACDGDGNVYVADSGNDTIRRITPAGDVTTLAGQAGSPGSADGTGGAAKLDNPVGVACDPSGNVYVADCYNQTIRKITPAGAVTTLAGAAGQASYADGTVSEARFHYPMDVACDSAGNVYVAEYQNQTIRKITPGGVVSTLAGSVGQPGSADGVGGAARFNRPGAVACDGSGNVYVADTQNHTVRMISPAGEVTTIAGSAGSPGSADGLGTAATFNQPYGIACDAVGNLYIGDGGNSTVRKAVCPATLGGFVRVAQSTGGTISLSEQTGPAPAAVAVQHGDTQTFDIVPDTGYLVIDVVVDGVSQGPITTFSFHDVAEDHAITAAFGPLFGAPADFVTGSGPYDVIATDLDGDGRQDLATANWNDDAISILIGSGDGTFAGKVDYGAGDSPASLAAADFNGDGHQDLAVSNLFGNTVSVLIGNGNGTLQDKVGYATGISPTDVAAADFNGDGRQDLAVANQTPDTVSVLIGNGDGTFQGKVDYATGVDPSYIAVADYDADGAQDLAVTNGADNTVSILRGNGNGTFRGKVDYATGHGPSSIATADLNGDGDVDLAVANITDTTISVLIGNGDGTFQGKADYWTGYSAPWAVAVADFDGDIAEDLAVVAGGVGGVTLLFGKGDGTFHEKVDYGAGGAHALAAADLDGDGAQDLVTADAFGNTVGVLLNAAP